MIEGKVCKDGERPPRVSAIGKKVALPKGTYAQMRKEREYKNNHNTTIGYLAGHALLSRTLDVRCKLEGRMRTCYFGNLHTVYIQRTRRNESTGRAHGRNSEVSKSAEYGEHTCPGTIENKRTYIKRGLKHRKMRKGERLCAQVRLHNRKRDSLIKNTICTGN